MRRCDFLIVVIRDRLAATQTRQTVFVPNTMGITGLLGLVSPVTKDTSLGAFRGKVVAVDAMCW